MKLVSNYHCSTCVWALRNIPPHTVRMPLSDKKEDKEAEALLHSNLWRTLFRGGYQENKDNKFARTISGVYVSSWLVVM